MWFEKLTGFKEASPEEVRAQLRIEGNSFVSSANQERFTFGTLEVTSLGALKEQVASSPMTGKIDVQEIVADVQKLHIDPTNENALFQAASQFNLLEMVNPHVTPEQGVSYYAYDYTQGPACAIACGAGTIYRNYFVPIGDQIGQSTHQQINCIDDIGLALGNKDHQLWKMSNGYALPSMEGLITINQKIAAMSISERESLKERLKVGIQWNTEVTLSASRHKVSQIYCSALPVAYSQIEAIYWESFARVILEATYEVSICAAIKNKNTSGCDVAYLTLVGGGAFGNEEHWIMESLFLALEKYRSADLKIRIVSYGQSNEYLLRAIETFYSSES